MKLAGETGTPLSKKLGLKTGSELLVKNATEHSTSLLEPVPSNVTIGLRC